MASMTGIPLLNSGGLTIHRMRFASHSLSTDEWVIKVVAPGVVWERPFHNHFSLGRPNWTGPWRRSKDRWR